MKIKLFFVFLISYFLVTSCDNIPNAYNQIGLGSNYDAITASSVTVTQPIDTVKKDTIIPTPQVVIPENPDYPYIGIKHVDSALYYANIGIREKGGNNQGFNNKYFQQKIYEQGWRRGASWCAFAVKTFLKMAGAIFPTSSDGLAQHLIKKESVSATDVKYGRKEIGPGWIPVWKHGETYKGHTGITYSWDTYSGVVVEGNTGPSGGSDGDGEYIKHRKIEPRNYFRIVNFTPVRY